MLSIENAFEESIQPSVRIGNVLGHRIGREHEHGGSLVGEPARSREPALGALGDGERRSGARFGHRIYGSEGLSFASIRSRILIFSPADAEPSIPSAHDRFATVAGTCTRSARRHRRVRFRRAR